MQSRLFSYVNFGKRSMKGYGSVAAKSTKVDPKDECRHRIRASAPPPAAPLRGVYLCVTPINLYHASLFCAGARTAALGRGRADGIDHARSANAHSAPPNPRKFPTRRGAISNPLPAIRNQRKPLKTKVDDEF